METQLLALRERIASAGLDSLADTIMAQARPAVDLILDGASSGEIGECRFGGAPDLPPSIPWPRDENGKAFAFLLQVNLAQVPAFDENPLPPRGMLWLFLGSDEGAADVAHRILVWEGDEELRSALCPPPEELANEHYASIPPHRLRLELRADVPHWSSRDYNALMEDWWDKEDAYSHLLPNEGAKGYVGQLLGHVSSLLYDPREDAFVVREFGAQYLYGHAESVGLDISGANAWQNLLCLFSVLENHEWLLCIWDAGYLNFLIHQDDLQKLDFSRVYASVESS